MQWYADFHRAIHVYDDCVGVADFSVFPSIRQWEYRNSGQTHYLTQTMILSPGHARTSHVSLRQEDEREQNLFLSENLARNATEITRCIEIRRPEHNGKNKCTYFWENHRKDNVLIFHL